MLPFPIQLQAGTPIYEQVVFAVHKAVVTGQLKPGDPFPSVRAMSKALGVNPNTMQRVVSQLTREGVLEVFPGRGTFVCSNFKPSNQDRQDFLSDKIENLVVEARKLGVTRDELGKAIDKVWKSL